MKAPSAVIVLIVCLSAATPLLASSAVGDVVGKLTVGYQGWFGAKGDNSPHNSWIHWPHNSDHPYKDHTNFEIYPDTREYTHTYQTGYANLGNGQPAKLFSAWDKQTVDTHFKWMKEVTILNNIDTAALQRFASAVKRDPIDLKTLNGVADNVRAGAEAHDRKFYIMWDISNWNNFATEIIEDYDNNIKRLVSSKAYAHQNGKPVVCIWGFGFDDRPQDTKGAIALIEHFKQQGLYVSGGVGTQWRTDTTAWKDVFTKLDMLQPWTVGRYGNVKGAEDYKKTLEADHNTLKQHNIDYQPVLFAGSSWSNSHPASKRNENPRVHGDFMWRQFVNVRELDIPSCYVAMFDEYDEGTAIAKAAENKSMIPTDQYFLTMD
ncbi:unnamed protein product, partial [Oppiella nova]